MSCKASVPLAQRLAEGEALALNAGDYTALMHVAYPGVDRLVQPQVRRFSDLELVQTPHVTVRVALGVGKAIIAMPMLTLETSSRF